MKILFSEQAIHQRVRELGEKISSDYRSQGIEHVIALGILKGSFVFMADLVRQLQIPSVSCQFLGVSSYGNETQSSGEVKMTHDLSQPVSGQHILLIEDIADTGLTLCFIQNLMKQRGAESVRTAAFLVKPKQLTKSCQIDYSGFEIGNEFVVGYGLDHAENYRHLPYVAEVPSS